MKKIFYDIFEDWLKGISPILDKSRYDHIELKPAISKSLGKQEIV